MLRLITVPLILALMLLKGILWVLFVPLGRLLLKLTGRAGPLRLPLLLLFSPIIIPCIVLDRGTGGRVLEGEVIRPTFTLPFAFVRGPWTVLEKEDVRSAQLELIEGDLRSTLTITGSVTLAQLRRDDEMTARMIDKALAEPGLPNGMRWTGLRMTTFAPGAQLTCLYIVWKEDEPDLACINVKFTGAQEHEKYADDFVSSVLPSLPELEPGEDDDAVEPAASA